MSSSNTNQTGMEIVRPAFLPITLILIYNSLLRATTITN